LLATSMQPSRRRSAENRLSKRLERAPPLVFGGRTTAFRALRAPVECPRWCQSAAGVARLLSPLSPPLSRRPAGCPPSCFYDNDPSFDPRRAHKNFAKLRRRQRGQRASRVDPVDDVDLVAQAQLAPYPAGDERSDDKMRPYSVPFVDNHDGFRYPGA
jgi:hypothetical protein